MFRFLRVFAIFFGLIFVGNAFAAGYTCDSLKTYTSCNAGYYMSGTTCTACPSNSSTNANNTSASCTCTSGYTVGGTASGATTTTKTACAAIATTITLNGNNATTAGTTEVYGRYTVQMLFLDSARSQAMASGSGNAITAPSRAYKVTYNANGGTVSPTSATSTYTFNGYWSATSGGTQYINASGYPTNSGYTAAAALKANATWYAQWTGGIITVPTPTKAGCKFNGWYNASSGGTKIAEAGDTYKPTSDTTLYAQWTCMDISAPAKSLTYNGTTTSNGTAQSCANVTVSSPSGASVTYSASSGGTYSATAPTLTNVGSTTVYYKVAATNYTTKTGSYTCTMNAKAMTVSASNKTLTYNGSAQSCGTVSVTAPSSGATIEYGTTNGSYTTTSAITKTDAGTYTIYYQVTATNYTTKTGSFTCTVNKAANTLTLSASSGNMAYSTTKTFTVSKNTSGGTLSVTTSNSDVATASISGTTVTITSKAGYGSADITVTSAATDNYNSASAKYTITVDLGTITLNNQSASTAGTTAIYQKYNTNVYLDSARSKAMTASANPITIPKKSGVTFKGYYSATSGGTQYINANGYITSDGLTAGKALKANGTWYAQWSTCPAGSVCNGSSVTTCPAGSFCPEGSTSATKCPGLYVNSAAGSDANTDCYFTTTAGKYMVAATDTAQTTCPAKQYCTAETLYYPNVSVLNDGGWNDCPAISGRQMTTIPDNYRVYASDGTTVLNTSVTIYSAVLQSWTTGMTAITSCRAVYGFQNEAGIVYDEGVKYNATTGKYDIPGSATYYSRVNPGYYVKERYNATRCNNSSLSMIYKKAVVCPAGSYCPGLTSMPACSSGISYTDEGLGKYSCADETTNYASSAEKSTSINSCYLTTASGKLVKTANAAQESCTCGGYCPGSVTVYYGSTGGKTDCAAGKYNGSTGSSASSACKTTDAGYYAAKGSCSQTAVSAGRYTAGGATTANGDGAVTAGYYNTGCGTNATGSVCSTSYSGGTIAAGRYGAAGATTAQGSGAVNAGYYSTGGGTSATPTKAGTGCLSTKACGPIAAGRYGAAGATTAQGSGAVNAGYYSTGGGTSATPTAAGNGCLSSYSCGKVTAGCYTTSTGSTIACPNECPGDMTSAAGSDAKTDCKITCTAGNYLAAGGSTCSTCTKGNYCANDGTYNFNANSNQGIAACSGANQWQANTGKTSCDPVTDGMYKSNNYTLQNCGNAYYCKSGARTACTTATGWSTATTSATASAYTACYQTQTPSGCASGTIKRTASSISGTTITYGTASVSSALSANKNYYVSGTSCPVCTNLGAFYTTSAGGAIGSGSCYGTTDAGKYIATENTSTQTTCPAGSYCPATNVYYGKYGTSSGGQNLCPAGTANANTGSSAASACVTCAAGTYNTTTGNTTCSTCPAGSYCTGGSNKSACTANSSSAAGSDAISDCSCKAGYSGDASKSGGTCTACACGYYKGSAGNTSCTKTSAGYYATGTGNTGQTKATAGNYAAAGACSQSACAAPYSSSAAGSDDTNDCYLTTSATKYVAEAGKGEVTCAAGGYCPGGSTIYRGGTVTGRATTGGRTACAAGTKNANTGSSASSACTSCAAGTYSTGGASSCSTITDGCYGGAGSVKACPNSCSALNAFYTKSDSGRDTNADCYGTTAATKYVAEAGKGQVACTGGYCPGGTKVYYATGNGSTTGGRNTLSNWTCPDSSDAAADCYRGVTLNKNNMSGTLALPSSSGCRSIGGATGTTADTVYVYYGVACKLPTTALSGSATGTTYTGTTTWATSANAASGFVSSITLTDTSSTTPVRYAGKKYTCSGGYYLKASTNGACTACPDASYCVGISDKYYSTSTQGLSACSALDSTKTDGTYSSVSPRSANTHCRFTQNQQTVTEHCATKTSNTMSYSGSAWPANTYAVTAEPGAIISGNNTATATCSQCTGATYSAGGTATGCSSCDTNYQANTTAGKSLATQCQISCGAGQAVLEKNKACATVTGNNYKTGTALVNYGSTSPTASDKTSGWAADTIYACPSSYSISGTAAGNHDARTDCTISCAKGTQVVSANAACTTPSGTTWYTAAHSVSAGSTSGSNVKSCNTGYATANTTTATDHDEAADCKIGCSAGYYIPTAGEGCKVCTAGKYCSAISGIAQTSTSDVTGNVNAGYWNNGGGTNATGSVISGYSGGTIAAGYYGGAGATSSTGSGTVSGGYYSTGGGTSAKPTSAGTGCLSSFKCGKLSAAYYSNGGSTADGATCVSGKTCGTCDSNYRANTATGKTAVTQCETQCAAGTAVLTANKACATIQNSTYKGKYTAQHNVAYGSKSDISTCPTYYQDGNGAAGQANCVNSCAAGTQVASANADCTTPNTTNWYTDVHNVTYGKTSANLSKVIACDSDYANSGTDSANHAGVTSCKVTCAPGTYVASSGAACTDVGSGYYRAGTETVSQTKTGTLNACTDLGAIYKASDSGRDASTDCYATTTAKSYVKTAKDATETSCPAGSYCPGSVKVYYNSTGGSTPCPAGKFCVAGVSAGTACALGSYTSTTGKSACTACGSGKTTNGTGQTSCNATCDNASNVYSWASTSWSNNSVANLCKATACNENTYYTAKTETGYANTCTACGDNSSTAAGNTLATCACTQGYTHNGTVGGNSTSTSGCSLISGIVCNSGYYLPAQATACETCDAGYYCPSASKTYSWSKSIQGRTACSAGTYQPSTGKTSCIDASAGYYVPKTGQTGQTACTGATYQPSTGQSSCLSCPTATNNTADISSYNYWSSSGIHTNRYGCYATFKSKTLDDGVMSGYLCYVDTGADTYGIEGTNNCQVSKSELKCNGGYYNSTFNNSSTATYDVSHNTLTDLYANVCQAVGTGYYSANDALTRTACSTGLVTCGSGACANEADDCGRKLHMGANTIYLRSAKRGTPALNVKIGDKTFYGVLSTSLSSKAKVNKGGTTYSVVNDYQ